MTLSEKGSAKRRASAPPPAVAVAVSASTTATPRKPLYERFNQPKALEAWRPHLPGCEAWTWWALWNSAPGDGRSFHVSHSTLARRLGYRREHIARATSALQRRGLLILIHKGSARSHLANEYRIPKVLPPAPVLVPCVALGLVPRPDEI